MEKSLLSQAHAISQQRLSSVLFTEPEIFDREELKENKAIADEVTAFVLRKITKVPSWGIAPPVTEEKFQQFEEHTEKLGSTRELVDEILKQQPPEKRNEFIATAICADVAHHSGYGNCGEMGALGLMYLSKIRWPGRVGTFQIRRPESAPLPNDISATKARTHTFLVVGLGVNSKGRQDDYQSFGVNSVVCDPYSKEESYPVSEMYERLQNYYGLDPETTRPVLAKVDPHIDTIHLLSSNIFSANEFIEPFLNFKEALPDAATIAHQLHSFNISTLKNHTIDRMNTLIDRVPFLINKLNQMQLSLYAEHKGDSEQRQNLSRILACLYSANTLYSQLEQIQDPESCHYRVDMKQ